MVYRSWQLQLQTNYTPFHISMKLRYFSKRANLLKCDTAMLGPENLYCGYLSQLNESFTNCKLGIIKKDSEMYCLSMGNPVIDLIRSFKYLVDVIYVIVLYWVWFDEKATCTCHGNDIKWLQDLRIKWIL